MSASSPCSWRMWRTMRLTLSLFLVIATTLATSCLADTTASTAIAPLPAPRCISPSSPCSYSLTLNYGRAAATALPPPLAQPVATFDTVFVDRTRTLRLEFPFFAFNRTVRNLHVTSNGQIALGGLASILSRTGKSSASPSASASPSLLSFLSFDLLGKQRLHLASATGASPSRSQVLRFERQPGDLVVDITFFEGTNAIEVHYYSDTASILQVTAPSSAVLGPIIGIGASADDSVLLLDGTIDTSATPLPLAWQLQGITLRFQPTAQWALAPMITLPAASPASPTSPDHHRRRRLLRSYTNPSTMIPPPGGFNLGMSGRDGSTVRVLLPAAEVQVAVPNGGASPMNMAAPPTDTDWQFQWLMEWFEFGPVMNMGINVFYSGQYYNQIRVYSEGVVGLGSSHSCSLFYGDGYTFDDMACGPMIAVHERPGPYSVTGGGADVMAGVWRPYGDVPGMRAYRVKWASQLQTPPVGMGPWIMFELVLWESGEIVFNYQQLPNVGPTWDRVVTGMQGVDGSRSWAYVMWDNQGTATFGLDNAGVVWLPQPTDFKGAPDTISNGKLCTNVWASKAGTDSSSGSGSSSRRLRGMNDGALSNNNKNSSNAGAINATLVQEVADAAAATARELLSDMQQGSASSVRLSLEHSSAAMTTASRAPLPSSGEGVAQRLLADDEVFEWRLPFVVSTIEAMRTSVLHVSANGYMRFALDEQPLSPGAMPFAPLKLPGGSVTVKAPYVAFLWSDWALEQKVRATTAILGAAPARVAYLRMQSAQLSGVATVDMDVDVLVFEGSGRIEVRYYAVPITYQPTMIGWQNASPGHADDWAVSMNGGALASMMVHALIGSVLVAEPVQGGAQAESLSSSPVSRRLRRLLQQPEQQQQQAPVLPTCTAPSLLFLRHVSAEQATTDNNTIANMQSLLPAGAVVRSDEQHLIELPACDAHSFVFSVPPIELNGSATVPVASLRGPSNATASGAASSYTATSFTVVHGGLIEGERVPLGTLLPIAVKVKRVALADRPAADDTKNPIAPDQLTIELHGEGCATATTYVKLPKVVLPCDQ